MRTLAAPPFVLEPQLAAHAQEMFTVLSDPAIYEFENAPPIDEEWLRKRFARLESRGCCRSWKRVSNHAENGI